MSVTTPLKDIQITAKHWLAERETNPQFMVKGGMFCDDPGMGKTLSLLAMILDNPIGQLTLVVAPANVISVWKSEIAKHTSLPSRNIFSYHGSHRKNMPEKITQMINGWDTNEREHLIVLTSYGIIRSEYTDSIFKKDSLFHQHFDRVILDEAHFIKNRKAKINLCLSDIFADIKWLVTATPLNNSLDDELPYFKFLGLIDNLSHWRQIIPSHRAGINPKKLTRMVTGIHQINQWKSELLLRRDKSLLALPEKTETVEYISFTEEENEFYQTFFQYTQSQLSNLIKAYQGGSNEYLKVYGKSLRGQILVLILRLRQACQNPIIVINDIQKKLKMNPEWFRNDEEVITDDKLIYLNKNRFNITDCMVCLDSIGTDISIPCGHILCLPCWEEIIKTTNKCPYCQTHLIRVIPLVDLPAKPVITAQDLSCNVNKTDLDDPKFDCSSKINRAIQIVEDNIETSKIIIVSQWLSVLDHVETNLEHKNLLKSTVRIDGKVGLNEREDIIKQVQNDPNIRICLISLTCSAEGITLTSADILIHLDQWWNSLGKPEQMSNRIHRIGQTKTTRIIHLRTKKTIEERIEKLVSQKNNMIGLIENPEILYNETIYETQFKDKVAIIAQED